MIDTYDVGPGIVVTRYKGSMHSTRREYMAYYRVRQVPWSVSESKVPQWYPTLWHSGHLMGRENWWYPWPSLVSQTPRKLHRKEEIQDKEGYNFIPQPKPRGSPTIASRLFFPELSKSPHLQHRFLQELLHQDLLDHNLFLHIILCVHLWKERACLVYRSLLQWCHKKICVRSIIRI